MVFHSFPPSFIIFSKDFGFLGPSIANEAIGILHPRQHSQGSAPILALLAAAEQCAVDHLGAENQWDDQINHWSMG